MPLLKTRTYNIKYYRFIKKINQSTDSTLIFNELTFFSGRFIICGCLFSHWLGPKIEPRVTRVVFRERQSAGVNFKSQICLWMIQKARLLNQGKIKIFHYRNGRSSFFVKSLKITNLLKLRPRSGSCHRIQQRIFWIESSWNPIWSILWYKSSLSI